MGQVFCYGCRFLITETDPKEQTTRYTCQHFPNKIMGIISPKTEEFEDPEPATSRCFRPENTKPFTY